MTGLTAPEEARPGTGLDFDFSGLLELVGSDADFLGEFIALFDLESSRLLAEVREASGPGGARLERPSHALKGLLSHFGESEALELCRHLEVIASGRESADVDNLAFALAHEVALIRRELDRVAAGYAA